MTRWLYGPLLGWLIVLAVATSPGWWMMWRITP